jgi:hypothetical protein
LQALPKISVYAGEPLNLELQLVDAAGVAESLAGRTIVCVISRGREEIDRSAQITGSDASGDYAGFSFDGAVSLSVVAELGITYVFIEQLANGWDTIGEGYLVVSFAATGTVGGTLEGMAQRLRVGAGPDCKRVVIEQRGGRGLSLSEELGTTPEELIADLLTAPVEEKLAAVDVTVAGKVVEVDTAITELGEATSGKLAEVDDAVSRADAATASFDAQVVGLVSVQADQPFNEQEKAQARSNIGAPEEILPRTVVGSVSALVTEVYAVSGDDITIDTSQGFVRLYLPASGGSLTVSAKGAGSASITGNGRTLSGILASGIILPGGAPLQIYSDVGVWSAVNTDVRTIPGLSASLASAARQDQATRRSTSLVAAGGAARRARFAASPMYRTAGAVATRADVVDDGAGSAPAVDASGRLLVERATVNRVTSPLFASASGFSPGVVGSGGTIGSAWANAGNGSLEVISATGGRLRLRCFATGNPSGTSQGLQTQWFAKPVLTRGGLVGSGLLRIINIAAGANSFSRLSVAVQSRNSTSVPIVQGDSAGGNDTRVVSATDIRSAAFLASIPADHDQVRFRFIANLTSALPYDVTFEVAEPQAEDGASASDYTSFVNGSRSTAARALMPAVDHDVVFGGNGGYVWTTGNGPTVLASPQGTIAASNLLAIERANDSSKALTAREKTDIVAANYPPVAGIPIPHDAAIGFSGRSWRAETANKAWSIVPASNRQAYITFEVRNGDHLSETGAEAGKNRSEIKLLPTDSMALLPFDTDVWFSGYIAYQYDVAPPANITAVTMQIHNSPDAGEPDVSPLFAQRLQGDDLLFTVQGETGAVTTGNSVQQRLLLIPGIVKTSLADEPYFHRYVYRIRATRNGTSQLDIWWNGELVYSGINLLMGYNDLLGGFFKLGIYRPTQSSETLRVTNAMTEMSLTSLIDRVANPLPIA